jgi:hypothetical protein
MLLYVPQHQVGVERRSDPDERLIEVSLRRLRCERQLLTEPLIHHLYRCISNDSSSIDFGGTCLETGLRRDAVSVVPPEIASVIPRWEKRLTYVTTTRQATTGNRGMSVGTIIPAERLQGVKVCCPRCDTPAATIWRRFDYFGAELPLYFTKCRRCHRRRPIDADEAAFRLLEAGVAEPMNILHNGTPAANETEPLSPGQTDENSVAAAKALVENRRRAYGKKHPLTFAARSALGEAVGNAGDPQEGARILDALVTDQSEAVGRERPAVLANRYRAAAWAARAGRPEEALAALRALVVDQEKVLGADHANTLISRATIAQLVHEAGDHEAAIEMLWQVERDQIRVLGAEHPATEATHRLLAEWHRP